MVGKLWWCVAPLMVGFGVVVCGPPHCGACCVGVWLPSWWGVVRSCVVLSHGGLKTVYFHTFQSLHFLWFGSEL